MDAVMEKYATRAVPRYTSYPTAPHFAPALSGEVYRDWLVELDPAEPVSLYLHVPFCRKMCWYCGCNMKLASRYDPIAAYVEDLLAEIDLVAGSMSGRLTVSHVHWGGGTPTALSPEDLSRVMAALRERFVIGPDAELAIESDPRTLTDEMIEAIGREGFTRASFGIQEFDNKVQEAINRIQPPEMVERAVHGLRAAGVQGINFDLIYGLPHQTTGSLIETIRTCHEIGVDRLALFGYAHVPWMAKNQRMIPLEALPDREARADQARSSAEMLEALGYVPIGLDHFAKPSDPLAVAASDGTLRRNFQGYTTDRAETMIGLGATSIGRTPRGYVQNIAETGAWARAVRAGVLPIARGHAFSGQDLMRAEVIERLMCDGTVDLAETAEAYGNPPSVFDGAQQDLVALAMDGLIQRHGDPITVTNLGKSLIRVIAATFDQYLPTQKAKHSVAV